MSVPAYGLQEVGVRREQVGEFGVELVVTGTSSTEMRWIRPDGKRQKSVEGRQGASCRGVERAQGGCQGRTEDVAGLAGQDREPVSRAKELGVPDLARALPGPSARRHAGAASGLEVQ